MPKASRGAVRRASCLKSRSITLLCQSSIQRLRERTFLLIDCRPSSKSAPYQITATATVISHTPSLGDRVVPVGVLRAADTTHAYEDDAEIIARTTESDGERDTCRDWKGTKVSNDLSRRPPARSSQLAAIRVICFVTSAASLRLSVVSCYSHFSYPIHYDSGADPPVSLTHPRCRTTLITG